MSGPCWTRPVWRWSRRTLWGALRGGVHQIQCGPIVGSYGADIQITYRRSREQVAAITDATGPRPSAAS